MFSNTTRLHIQFGDCDPAGIVYYPNYFRYFDNATAALFIAALGMKKRDWLAHYDTAGIPMVDTGATFYRPSAFGDEVEIISTITALGRSSIGIEHKLNRDGELAVEGREKRVWVARDANGKLRSAPLPDAVRKALGG